MKINDDDDDDHVQGFISIQNISWYQIERISKAY